MCVILSSLIFDLIQAHGKSPARKGLKLTLFRVLSAVYLLLLLGMKLHKQMSHARDDVKQMKEAKKLHSGCIHRRKKKALVLVAKKSACVQTKGQTKKKKKKVLKRYPGSGITSFFLPLPLPVCLTGWSTMLTHGHGGNTPSTSCQLFHPHAY